METRNPPLQSSRTSARVRQKITFVPGLTGIKLRGRGGDAGISDVLRGLSRTGNINYRRSKALFGLGFSFVRPPAADSRRVTLHPSWHFNLKLSASDGLLRPSRIDLALDPSRAIPPRRAGGEKRRQRNGREPGGEGMNF